MREPIRPSRLGPTLLERCMWRRDCNSIRVDRISGCSASTPTGPVLGFRRFAGTLLIRRNWPISPSMRMGTLWCAATFCRRRRSRNGFIFGVTIPLVTCSGATHLMHRLRATTAVPLLSNSTLVAIFWLRASLKTESALARTLWPPSIPQPERDCGPRRTTLG